MRRWKSFKFQNISKETWCTRVKSHQNHTKHSGAQTKPFFYIKYRNYSMKSRGALKHFLVWFLFQDTLVYFDRRERSFSWWFKEQLLSYSLTFQRTLVLRQSKDYFFANIIFSPLTLITFVYFFEQIRISDQCKYSVWLRALWLIRFWFLFLIVLKMRRSFG